MAEITADMCLAQITAAQHGLMAIFGQAWTPERSADVYAKMSGGEWRYRYVYEAPEPYSFVAQLVHIETGQVDELFRCDGVSDDSKH